MRSAGYATLSIAWAGRISAPGYQVTPNEVKLFWEGKTDDPKYKLTTDWGAWMLIMHPVEMDRMLFHLFLSQNGLWIL